MRKFSESLRKHTMKIITLKTKKMIPLTNEEYESYFNHANCLICKKRFKITTLKKKYCRVRDHCH